MDRNIESNRVNILIVDDHPENLLALEAILTDPSYRLIRAESGEEALGLILRQEFALILLDVRMPGMDGFEVANLVKARERTRHVPIIFLTGVAKEVQSIYKAYSSGAVDFLSKPLDPEVVRAKVSVFVDLYRKTQEIQRQAELLHEAERRERDLQLVQLRMESEKRLEELVSNVPGVVWEIRGTPGDFRTTFVSRFVETLLGFPSTDWFKKPEFWLSKTHPEDRTKVEKTLESVFRTESPAALEFRWIRADQEVRWIQAHFAPLTRGDGRLERGVCGVAMDVTDIKRSENRQRFLAQAGLILGESFKTDDALKRVADLASHTVADWCEIEIGNHQEHSEISEEKVSAPIRIRGETLGTVVFGTKRKGRFSKSDLVMAEELARNIAFAIENSRLFEQSQKAIRLRDEFLSIASHELRTPITPLKIHVQSLRNAVKKGELHRYSQEKLESMLDRSDRQVFKLQKLVDELLDVSRISEGRMEIEPERFDLSELVREVVDQYSGQIRTAGCSLEVDVNSEVIGSWDRGRVERVIVNLLTNALKYGAGKPIFIKLEARGDHAVFKVRDNGVGILLEDQARIFERFERAASVRNYSGFGLGLYICREIVKAHGGVIFVESEPGQGSTFTVDLPVAGVAAVNQSA